MSSPAPSLPLPDRGARQGDAEQGLLPAPARWTVRLLGAVEAAGPAGTITRWPTRAVAVLLARLASSPERAHPREELVELLWPGVSLEVGRNRLRQTLSALKSLLEPRGAHAAPVLVADRHAVRVVPGALVCDARECEARARAGEPLHVGGAGADEFMPGYYDEWIAQERLRMAALFERAPRPPTGSAAAPTGSAAAPPAAPALAASAAPAASAAIAAPAPALPGYLTRTFGLEQTAETLLSWLRERRLVNVHGPGGSGKTRLAVEVARALAAGPRAAGGFDAVHFVPLLACESAAQVLQAAADAVGPGGRTASRPRLLAALEQRRVLLVLDNLEQLRPEAEREIASWLAAQPQLHVLGTSRRVLGLDGEATFELQGLALPPEGATLDELAASPPVALFVDRARAARADFHLGPRNAAAVAALVRLVGGMPLAIELAASRVRSLAPQHLLQRLAEGAGTPALDLLARQRSGASRDARHASMRATVAWSWRELDASQVALMQCLAVLVAPADETLVAGVAGLPPARARELLATLRDLALVATPAGEHAPSYVLLQPVREFAAEQAGPARQRAARRRLRAHLLELASGRGPADVARLAELLPHVHEAIVRAPEDDDARRALELAVALRALWEWEVLPLADLRALEQCLGGAAGDAALLGDALELLAFASVLVGLSEAGLAHVERARALALDDRRRSIVLARWAMVRYHAGGIGPDLLDAAAEAVALAERSGDAAARAGAYRLQGLLVCNLGLEYARSEALMARAQALAEQLGDHRLAQRRLFDRAIMWAWLGREAEAAQVLHECGAGALRDGDWQGATTCARQLGRVYVRMRAWDAAAAAFRRGLRLAWERRHAVEIAVGLLHLPDALVHQPAQLELAARLHGFARAHWTRLFGALNRIEQREVRRTRLLLRLRLGAGRAEALRVQGLRWSKAEAVAAALAGEPAA
ncbi:MAG: NACHT domain-containing protein [Rubrivivax sp.]